MMRRWRRYGVVVVLVGLLTGSAAAQVAGPGVRVFNMVASIDPSNSSTNLLSLSSVFVGTASFVRDYSNVNVFVSTDKASATNGLQMQFSTDRTNWVTLFSTNVLGSVGASFSQAVAAPYFRVQYANTTTGGAVGGMQASFILQTMYRADAFPSGSLQSVAGQVDIKAGALISEVTGFGNLVLSSAVDSGGFRPPSLSSMFTKVWGVRLDSTSLVAGAAGMRTAVYTFDVGLESLVSSVGFYSTNIGLTKLFGALPLWSSEYAANGGIQKSGLCGPARCWPLFLTSVGDDLSFAVTSTGNEGRVRVNLLWSYER